MRSRKNFVIKRRGRWKWRHLSIALPKTRTNSGNEGVGGDGAIRVSCGGTKHNGRRRQAGGKVRRCTGLFVGMIMGSTAMLMAASAVLLRGVGMLLSSIVPSHFMMVRGLAMVMGGSFMVSRSVVVVFNG